MVDILGKIIGCANLAYNPLPTCKVSAINFSATVVLNNYYAATASLSIISRKALIPL